MNTVELIEFVRDSFIEGAEDFNADGYTDRDIRESWMLSDVRERMYTFLGMNSPDEEE